MLKKPKKEDVVKISRFSFSVIFYIIVGARPITYITYNISAAERLKGYYSFFNPQKKLLLDFISLKHIISASPHTIVSANIRAEH